MCLRQSYTTGKGKYRAPAVMTRDRCYFLFWALMIHLHSYYPMLLKSDFLANVDLYSYKTHLCSTHAGINTEGD